MGDSPLFGAGAYAIAGQGAASATGDGELIMRALLSLNAVQRIALSETSAQAAATSALARALRHFPGAGVGLILIDGAGGIGAAHSTAAMPRAWWRGGEIGAAFSNALGSADEGR